MNNSHNHESGQVLILSLCFLVFSSLICLYFFSFVESTQRVSLQEMSERENTIARASKISNLLNAISINNMGILSAIGGIGGAWQESASWSFAAAIVHPYWEQGPFSSDKKTNEIIKKIFSTMDMRTGRNFLIAKALSDENIKKTLELTLYAPNIGSTLSKVSNQQTFCLAISMAANNNNIDNALGSLKFFKQLFFPSVYIKNCAVFSDTTAIAGFNNKLTTQITENDLFGFYAPQNYQALQNFSKNLLLSDTQLFTNTATNNYHVTLRNFFFELLFKKSAPNYDFKKKKSTYIAAIVHPNIILGNKCANKTKASIFTVLDFKKINNCGVDSSNSLRAFLYPAWSPIIVGRKTYEL